MAAKRAAVVVGMAVLGLAVSACGSRGMRTVHRASVTSPGPGEALVVFMRPTGSGEVTSTSVFDLRPDGDRFVAILRAQTRFAYRTTPGRTRFMLVSTGGVDQFMDAELSGGKTYYATITYEGAGNVNAYVLRPLTSGQPEGPDLQACRAACAWVENTAKSEAWGRNHLRDLPKRKARFLPAWEALAPRPALVATDGR